MSAIKRLTTGGAAKTGGTHCTCAGRPTLDFLLYLKSFSRGMGLRTSAILKRGPVTDWSSQSYDLHESLYDGMVLQNLRELDKLDTTNKYKIVRNEVNTCDSCGAEKWVHYEPCDHLGSFVERLVTVGVVGITLSAE